jgi:hypothetical protein
MVEETVKMVALVVLVVVLVKARQQLEALAIRQALRHLKVIMAEIKTEIMAAVVAAVHHKQVVMLLAHQMQELVEMEQHLQFLEVQ